MVTPKATYNSSKSHHKQVDYGVGSTSFKGLFGDLILHADGKYTLTEDTHGGTWDYAAKNDSVILTGWLSIFKTQYLRTDEYIAIYTGM